MSINIRVTQHQGWRPNRKWIWIWMFRRSDWSLRGTFSWVITDDSTIKLSNLCIERSWLDCWEYLATSPWFVYFLRKRKTFIAWCSSSHCMISFTSWWVSSYLEFPKFSRGRLGWREVRTILYCLFQPGVLRPAVCPGPASASSDWDDGYVEQVLTSSPPQPPRHSDSFRTTYLYDIVTWPGSEL